MKYKGFNIIFANIDRNRMYRTESATVGTYWPTFTAAARYVLTCTRAAEDIEKSGKENRYIVRGENTLGYITGTQKPGQTPVGFVVLAVNVEAGGDPTLINRETVATDYRPATREDENTFNIHLF